MNSKKLKLCLIHLDAYSPEMPARPAITEIYGTYMPSLGHEVTWISSSNEKDKFVKKEKYNQVTVYTIPYAYPSDLYSKASNFLNHYYIQYKLMSKILENDDFDIIQVRNDVFSALMCLYFKNK